MLNPYQYKFTFTLKRRNGEDVVVERDTQQFMLLSDEEAKEEACIKKFSEPSADGSLCVNISKKKIKYCDRHCFYEKIITIKKEDFIAIEMKREVIPMQDITLKETFEKCSAERAIQYLKERGINVQVGEKK